MRRLLLAATLGVVASAMVTATAAATTITPAGVDFEGVAAPATFAIGTNEVVCNSSTVSGAIPAEPDNEAIGSPVSFDVEVPTFDDCTVLNHTGMSEVGITAATVTANDTNDSWEATFDDAGSGATVELTVPEDGLEIDVPSASCGYTAAPSAPEGIVGDWTSGLTAEDVSQLTFAADALGISSSGGPCGSPTSMNVDAVYSVANMTDAEPIQVANLVRRKWWANNQAYAGAGEAVSATETPTKLKFTWIWGGSTNTVECEFSLTPSLTNAPDPGLGTISSTQVTISNCSTMLMQTCAMTSIQAMFPTDSVWKLKAERIATQDRVEISQMKIRMTFVAQGGACQLAGANSPFDWIGRLRPEWNNTTGGGGNSWTEFKYDTTTGTLYEASTSPTKIVRVEGKLRWKTGAGNVLTLVAP